MSDSFGALRSAVQPSMEERIDSLLGRVGLALVDSPGTLRFLGSLPRGPSLDPRIGFIIASTSRAPVAATPSRLTYVSPLHRNRMQGESVAFKLRKGFERSVAVGFDPEFADVGQQKVAPKRRRWRIRRMSVFALLACSGCHTLLTGSPISLWHIERLDHPAIVKEIAGDGLILDGGRWVKIRFMKRLPADDPVFVEVLNRGVEVGSAGEVFGLIDPPRV